MFLHSSDRKIDIECLRVFCRRIELMSKRLTIISVLTLLSISVASAQTPTPDALAAARDLVNTLKLSDQFRALLPGILLSIRPVLTQDRPEMERDFDATAPKIVEAYAPHLKA